MVYPPLPSSSLTGQLFTYGSNRVAFESLASISSSSSSSSSSSLSPQPNIGIFQEESSLQQQQQQPQPLLLLPPPNKCILLGGLSDGFLPVPYTHALSEMICQFPYHPSSFSLPTGNLDNNEPPPLLPTFVSFILRLSY